MNNKYLLPTTAVLAVLLLIVAFTSVRYVTKEQQKMARYQAAVAAAARANSPVLPPGLELRGDSHLEEAVTRLGDKLPEVAAWYGYTPTQLRDLMRNDHTLWLDEQGRLFYKEDATVTSQGIITAESTLVQAGAGALYPLEDTFRLHSNPNAKRVIYLDFNGTTLSGVAWNSYNGGNDIIAPAWDIDGNRDVFGDLERQYIQNIWKRVAEDYAPFDVDITTEEPPKDRLARTSLSDEYYGTTALISPISGYFGNYGGFGYIGIFDTINNLYYEPALVFPEKLANGEKYIAEAISHETGHNLGLDHDGTTSGITYYGGHGDWAPIMGNSYYKPITQWSKGEYSGANNRQDDLAIIVSNGVLYKDDDCGNTQSSACTFLYSNGTVFASGIIERAGDIDVMSFIAAPGPVSFVVSTASIATNLSLRVLLNDTDGNVIASAVPTTGTASISTSVPGGTYYLSVEAVGAGDPVTTGYSNYASLGQFSVSGTIQQSGEVPPVASMSALPTSGTGPLVVQFSSDGSTDPDGTIVSYSWDFGDGTQATLANPQKTYSTAGTYVAQLTITDTAGLSDTTQATITVTNALPVALFTTTPNSGSIPLLVLFDASRSYDSDGSIASYSWDFGDGSFGGGATTSHTYQRAGTFIAQLTVTDNTGASRSSAITVTVTDPNALETPTNLSATSNAGLVTLSWTDNSQSESGFQIYRAVYVRTGTPVFTLVGTVATNTSKYTDTPTADGTYLYRVAAFTSQGTVYSNYSNTYKIKVSGTTTSGSGKCSPWPQCKN